MIELKPCPFCGLQDESIATHMEEYLQRYIDLVECENCGAKGPPGSTKETAKISWNRRSTEERKIEFLLNRLRHIAAFRYDVVGVNLLGQKALDDFKKEFGEDDE